MFRRRRRTATLLVWLFIFMSVFGCSVPAVAAGGDGTGLLPEIIVTPNQLDVGYSDTSMSLIASGSTIWASGDTLTLDIYQIVPPTGDATSATLTLAAGNIVPTTITDSCIDFTLLFGLPQSNYRIVVKNGSNNIARADFAVISPTGGSQSGGGGGEIPIIDISPSEVPEGSLGIIAMTEPCGQDLWSTGSTLNLKIIPDSNNHNLAPEMIIQDSDISKNDTGLSFLLNPALYLPAGGYCLQVLDANTNTIIAEGTFGVYIKVSASPNQITYLQGNNSTITLTEPIDQPNVWASGDSLSLKLLSYNDESITENISPSNIGDSLIEFQIPADLEVGQYGVAVLRGNAQIAMGSFTINPVLLDTNPNLVVRDYGDLYVDIFEPEFAPNLWESNDLLDFDVLRWNENIGQFEYYSSFSRLANDWDGNINLYLGTGLPAGIYKIDISKFGKLIAYATFQIIEKWQTANPFQLINGYQNTYMTLDPYCDNWNDSDKFQLKIYELHYDPITGLTDRNPVKTISDGVLVYYNQIHFTLPTGLGPNNYQIDIIKDSTVVAQRQFIVYTPKSSFEACFQYSEPIVIHEPGNNVWNASDKLQVKIYGENGDQIATADTITFGTNQISFPAPPTLVPGNSLPGDYFYQLYKFEVVKNPTTTPATIDMGTFHVHTAEISPYPYSLEAGYKIPVPLTLKKPSYIAGIWSSDNVPVMKLIKCNNGPQDTGIELSAVSVNDESLTVNLPAGLENGGYEISFLKDINTNDEIDHLDQLGICSFEIRPPKLSITTDELPPAYIGNSYYVLIQTQGYGYDWTIDNPGLLPPGLCYTSCFDGLQLNGIPSETGSYTFTVKVSDGLNVTYKQFTLMVYDDSPQLVVDEVNGLPGSTVTVPISGLNLMGAEGVQFALSYDPSVTDVQKAASGDTLDIESDIPGIIWSANIVPDSTNPTLNTLYLTMSSNSPLPDGNLCRIKFQIKGAEGSSTVLHMEPIDGIFLSGGDNSIQPTVVDGNIGVAKYGDVNGNGSIDVGDAVLILRHVVGYTNLSPEQQAVADVCADSGIDITDAIVILQYIVRLKNVLPFIPQ